MKAITLWQPWASLMVEPRPCDCLPYRPPGHPREIHTCHRLPFKTIETRSWPAPKSLIHQTVAIHAAKRPPDYMLLDGMMVVRDEDGWWLDDQSDPPNFRALPLGAVVGTGTLVACVEMTNHVDPGDPECIVVDDDTLTHAIPGRFKSEGLHVHLLRDVTDQRPFGHFEVGRWAWVFEDVVKLPEPIPATGRQGVWTWN